MRGLRAPPPPPCGTFLYGQKGAKKPPGESPRSPPPASPGGRYSIFDFICAPTNRGWFYPSAYPSSAACGAVIRRSAERLARRRKRRLSTHESYRKPLLWHIGAVQVYRVAIRRSPLQVLPL